MSGICSGVWTCLMWLPAFSFCRSNNRFRFTRWIREICPMDGLRSFMVVLITASSKTDIDDLWLEMCEFEKQSQYCPLTYYPSWEISSVGFGVTHVISPSWRLQKIISHVLDAALWNTCLLFARPAYRYECVAHAPTLVLEVEARSILKSKKIPITKSQFVTPSFTSLHRLPPLPQVWRCAGFETGKEKRRGGRDGTPKFDFELFDLRTSNFQLRTSQRSTCNFQLPPQRL